MQYLDRWSIRKEDKLELREGHSIRGSPLERMEGIHDETEAIALTT